MKRYFLGFLAFVLLLAGCQEKDQGPVKMNPAPRLVSCNPSDGTQGLYGDALTVKMTFDQNVKCTSDKKHQISISGSASVESVSAYMAELTIELSGLQAGETYALVIPAGTVEGTAPIRKRWPRSALPSP